MRNFLITLLALCTLPVLAQDGNNIPVGTWRIHTPYRNALHLAIDDNNKRAYASSSESLLYADSDGSVHGLTVLDGLTSMEFSTIAYDPTTKSLVIAYDDGNIDILRDNNSLTNVNDIFRSTSLVGSKSINHILVENGTAYLAADFGVSILNLTSLEITETWKNLSSNSSENPVYSSSFTTDKDSIFLATKNGVMGAKIAPGINLMDFNNWKSYGSSDGLPTTNVVGVASFNGFMYAAVNANGLYYFNGTQWLPMSTPITSTIGIKNIRTSQAGLGVSVCADYFGLVLTSPNTFFVSVQPGQGASPLDCDYDAQGTMWVADQSTGLWSGGYSGFQTYKINSPRYNSHFKLHYKNNNMVSVAGAYDKTLYQPTYNNLGYYEFQGNDHWNSYFYFYNGLDSRDLIDAQYAQDGKLYLASYMQGLYVRATDGTYTLYDHTNSNLIEAASGTGITRVSGLGIDSKGNIWVSNLGDPYATTLHKITPAGTWTSYSLTQPIGNTPSEIEVDSKDNKWIILAGGASYNSGIMVFNENNVPREKYLNTTAGSGGLPSLAVYSLALDHNGHLWAGTAAGVTVLYNASTYLSSPKDFTQPIYAGFPLLFDRHVYDIVIDGGNRKWIGTDNGIWLMNEDCSRIITTFNTDNSPLISNYILDMEINALTGELFVATDKGLMSFRSDATQASKDYSNVKVFPNPVKPGFTGYLTVSGLIDNTTVKITDVTGQMVFQDKSNGGTLSWNLIDYSGKRIRTGIYLVFLTDDDGTETKITQFAVVE